MRNDIFLLQRMEEIFIIFVDVIKVNKLENDKNIIYLKKSGI